MGRAPSPGPRQLHRCPTRELLELLHAGDRDAVEAVGRALPALEAAVEAVVGCWRAGGRLLYVGAGTSGRIGALDAAECPPTFGVSPARVLAVVAGGPEVLLRAAEGAEDDEGAGREAMVERGVGAQDAVVGLSASGSTPFTCAALEEAARRGATCIAVTGVAGSRLARAAVVAVVLEVGRELVEGSTRLKAGTAQKLVCNALSTAVFVRLGRVLDDQMVGVRPASAKLRRRAVEILSRVVGCGAGEAEALLAAAGDHLPTAVLMARAGLDGEAARRRLQRFDGDLVRALRSEAAEGT